MKPAILVRGLSKHYQLGTRARGQYQTLRENLSTGVGLVLRKAWHYARGKRPAVEKASSLWALRDVSFDVSRGEAVGIIGCNGAGKSTLLKILSRITEPTAGRAELRGSFGSLLEVGTGFHPELTGRENIFLNGAILGMTRQHVQKRFDAIVAFAEMEQFLDTPVKRYSSGMYVRLAFAVAAHLEPDILVIDEVLAVGDLSFQRKCLEHSRELSKRGGTVLLVSHNMFAIKALCRRALYLSHGRVECDGSVEQAIERYEKDSQLTTLAWAEGQVGNKAAQAIFIHNVELLDDKGSQCSVFDHGERMRLRIHYEMKKPLEDVNFVVAFIRSDGVACCNHVTSLDGFEVPFSSRTGFLHLRTPQLKLVAERYQAQVLVRDRSFQRLYSAVQGPGFHVRDEIMNPTHFGVFHEKAEWSWHQS
jgi:lipopolysaccharide transport system ATP-binding protein